MGLIQHQVGDLKALGATHVLSYQSDHLVDNIIYSNGEPIDSVLDVMGDPLFSPSLEALKKGGKFCISESAGVQTTNIDFRTLYLKHITRMLKAISDGLIKPVIDRTFPLEETQDAQVYFKESDKLGKVVLLPDEKTL
ncbi:NADPH:quinone reductase-like Zn-dependent oxidoreductase [Alkalibacillus almallahensis]|nr:NADPH:quinone reductase-like Zn-dependent oxidoreductase [Alkalibacillus almallahensis]